jgi:hypothetical protein
VIPNVGVEGELEHQHRLEDEVRRGVAQAVADLSVTEIFAMGDLEDDCLQVSLRDDVPTMIANSPGSTTWFMSMS